MRQHPNKILKDFRKLLRLYLSGAVFVAIDTETTSLTPSTGKIIEIGAVKFDQNGVISQINQLINPKVEIPEFITSLTHITNSMVQAQPDCSHFLPSFSDYIKNTVLVAHNAQFDLNFINAELEAAEQKLSTNKVIDTLQLCRWAYPTLGKYKLDYLAAKMKIESGTHHRAYDDAKTCMEIFLRVLQDTKPIQKL